MANRWNAEARKIPHAGASVECVLEDGTRFGPLELAGMEGEHALIRLECGISFPVPARTIVAARPPKRRASSASGERIL